MMTKWIALWLGVLTSFALVSCRKTTLHLPVTAASPANVFFSAFKQYEGQAFAGRVVANHPPIADDPFAGQTLIMHVRECLEEELKIPFHVSENRSRTWIITKTGTGLRLKHDHRLEDGTDDPVTLYGGDTAAPGTSTRQEFPVDAESIDTFQREGLAGSVTNVWAMEIEPGKRFVYELSRPDGRLFRVEFDLTKPIPPPPPPWG